MVTISSNFSGGLFKDLSTSSAPPTQPLWAGKAEIYIHAVGSYIAWRTDVDLGPPAADIAVPPDDLRYLAGYYSALQYILYETGFPETKDRTKKLKINVGKDRPTIVAYASPVDCMGTLLEGL